jgi:hypothetical protein
MRKLATPTQCLWYLHPGESGTVETYLRGVVPHEIGPECSLWAVEAQTIIARTYALRNLRRFAADDYELCADTHCQVYKGLTGTVPLADPSDRGDEGVGADLQQRASRRPLFFYHGRHYCSFQ